MDSYQATVEKIRAIMEVEPDLFIIHLDDDPDPIHTFSLKENDKIMIGYNAFTKRAEWMVEVVHQSYYPRTYGYTPITLGEVFDLVSDSVRMKLLFHLDVLDFE